MKSKTIKKNNIMSLLITLTAVTVILSIAITVSIKVVRSH